MASRGNNKLHEKHQLVLANMLREEDNKFCADCHAKGPRWASWNIGVFMCIRCAGIHRNLGVHISKVKSVNLDSWTPEQIATIQKGGNGIAREMYEANLPTNFRRPQDDYAVEQFIRSKYERKLYIAKDQPPVTKATATKSSEAVVKNKRSSDNNHIKLNKKKDQLLSVPRPAQQSKRSTTPPPSTMTSSHNISASPSVPTSLTAAATMATSKSPVDLLTGMTSTTTAQQVESPWQPLAQQPSLGEDPQKAVKEGILSLYEARPTPVHNMPYQQAYTAQGYPVHAYQYQQQQMAAMRIAQQQQQQQHVRAVEEQMRSLKQHQGQSSSVMLGNGQPFQSNFPPASNNTMTSFPQQSGGQTLNPHLW